jgi:N-glycosylase/DNA lyase
MPTEEWSRAIPNPDRVILLRQTSSRIYYTSVCPPTACQPSATTLNSADLLFIQSYFALSLPTPTGGGGETASPSLMQLYRAWAELDPALFGRAYAEGRVPRGVRVLRQDVWECLVS